MLNRIEPSFSANPSHSILPFLYTFESGGDCHVHFFNVELAIFQAILSLCVQKHAENAIAHDAPPRTPNRSHNIALINKTKLLNDTDFIIHMLYK